MRTKFDAATLCTALFAAATFFGVCECEMDKAALLIIDMQDCFISGGSLAVNGGDDIIPTINTIRNKYRDEWTLVVRSQDWHLPGHVSFASSHPGISSPMDLEYSPTGQLCTGPNISVAKFPGAVSCQAIPDTKDIKQTLWPDHCIQNVFSGPTSSAFASKLDVQRDDLIIQKGTDLDIDSYSAFFDNGGFGKTTLDRELRARGITYVFVTGLAADYCVYFTSLDAQRLGYETYYVMDATRPVSDVTYKAATADLAMKGVNLITTDMIPGVFQEINQVGTGTRPVSLSLFTMAAIAAFINRLL